MFFFGLIGLGVSAALVADGWSLGGECLPLGSTSVGDACPTPGEHAAAIPIRLGLLSGFLSVILICAAPLVALIDRISPFRESGPGSDGVSEQMQRLFRQVEIWTLTPESAYTSMGIPEIRRQPPTTPRRGAKT